MHRTVHRKRVTFPMYKLCSHKNRLERNHSLLRMAKESWMQKNTKTNQTQRPSPKYTPSTLHAPPCLPVPLGRCLSGEPPGPAPHAWAGCSCSVLSPGATQHPCGRAGLVSGDLPPACVSPNLFSLPAHCPHLARCRVGLTVSS